MPRLRLSLLALLMLLSQPARADFSDGLRAFDAGDYADALQTWRPLAAAGDADAQLALAGMYLHGVGVAADPARAAALYRQAAEGGHVMGQLNLGDLYSRGVGVARDAVAAYMWLELAARQDHAWARQRRDQVAAAMSAEQIACARRRADRWMPAQSR